MSRGNIERYYSDFTLSRSTNDGWEDSALATVGTYQGFVQVVSGGEVFEHFKLDDKVDARLYCGLDVPAVYNDVVEQGTDKYRVVWPSGQTGGISNTLHHKELLLTNYGGEI